MPLDLQYLLSLQSLREATGGALDEIFNALSKIAVDVMPYIGFLVLWGLSRKWGYRFLLTHWCAEVINGIIKLSVCAYRPWIRSEQIVPAGDSKTAATGYSFPSGHSVSATSSYGTIAVSQHKKRRWLQVTAIVLLVLTGFSRNFLGVHTPQDVAVGILEGCCVIALAGFLMKWMDGNNRRADILSAVGVLVVIGTLFYIELKTYPMDYDANGKLLVNPQSMMNDCYKACGGLLGLIAGSLVERHRVHYEVPKGSALLPILVGVGLGLVFSWKTYLAGATVVAWFGGHWGNLLARFIMVFFGVGIWPMVIRKFCREEAESIAA